MSLIKTISKVSGLTLISRMLGFVRDVLLARFLGASLIADCFFVAFKLPNFFRRLFAEGAFNFAFVPIFTELLKSGNSTDNKAAARRFAEESLAVLLPILIIFTAVALLFMPWIMVILAPGFVDDPEKFALAVDFTRTTFPYLLLISLVSLMAGVLNGMQRFSAAAAAPILLNLTLIASLLGFNETELLAGTWLTRAVTAAGVLQLLWLMFALSRARMTLKIRFPRITPKVRQLGIVMLPVALGAGAVQLNLLIDIVLASFLPEGSLSYLFYADRLNQLPIGVIGVAVGTVLLPMLTQSITQNKVEKAQHDQNRAIEAALFLTLPATAALMIIPLPLVSVLFERGAFDASDSLKTASALFAYAAGLPAYVLVKVLAPAFFARKDTKTPVRIGMIALVVNLIFNLLLMGPLLHVGLAVATAISAWVNVGLLYLTLKRRALFSADQRLKRRLIRMMLASAIMGICCYYVGLVFAEELSGALAEKIVALVILVLAGVASYFAAAHILGAMRIQEARTFFTSKK